MGCSSAALLGVAFEGLLVRFTHFGLVNIADFVRSTHLFIFLWPDANKAGAADSRLEPVKEIFQN